MTREILLVDDDTSLKRLMREALEKDGYTVRTADNAEDGLAELRRKRPDLLVLDVRLPGMSGFDLCRKIRSEKELQALPVIFLTSRKEELDRVLGLELGGDDYVIKPFSTPELLARVKVQLRRMTQEGTQVVLTSGPLKINMAERTAVLAGRALELTPKEFELLALLLQKRRQALSRAFITERVWEQDYTGSSRTVDTHVNMLRRRLGKLRDCLQTVEKTGYRWVDPPDDEEGGARPKRGSTSRP